MCNIQGGPKNRTVFWKYETSVYERIWVFWAQCRYTKIAQEYLNTVTYNIPVLLRIKYW